MARVQLFFLLFMVSLAGLFGLWLVWERFELDGSIAWRARRFRTKEGARLRAAPIGDLLSAVREAIPFERWEQLGPAPALLREERPEDRSGDRWTDATLLAALDELFAAVRADDAAQGRFGRDSGEFELYDCGLVGIREALQARRAPANTA